MAAKYQKQLCYVLSLWLILFSLSGCRMPAGTTLISGGYGYTVGDIVHMDTARTPAVGDVVQYNARINNSDFGSFGPGIYLAKITAIPGDSVVFYQTYYETNGIKVQPGGLASAIWGSQQFDNITGMSMTVPEAEFLTDKFIGYEYRSAAANSSFPGYVRYTVKRKAIIGVITEKVGHDQKFEDRQKNVVY
ncbi:MAG: hypothetical protein Q7R50_06115 [Dehalococcoidales bacterium]|nr:hypothetical protein [Dehalococcoidales bacterium]